MLKFVYSFFLGLLLAVFIGMGIASFYPEPKAPEYSPAIVEDAKPDRTDEQIVAEAEAQKSYEQSYQTYNQRSNDYSRNVAMIALAAAVIFMVLGLALESRASVIADGVLLGGVFTLLYSIGRSFAGDDPKYSFVVVSAGLITTMLVGYRKFGLAQKPSKSKKR